MNFKNCTFKKIALKFFRGYKDQKKSWGKTSTFGQVKQFANFKFQLKIYESLYFGRTSLKNMEITPKNNKIYTFPKEICENKNSQSLLNKFF